MLCGNECSVHMGACFSGGSRDAPADRGGKGQPTINTRRECNQAQTLMMPRLANLTIVLREAGDDHLHTPSVSGGGAGGGARHHGRHTYAVPHALGEQRLGVKTTRGCVHRTPPPPSPPPPADPLPACCTWGPACRSQAAGAQSTRSARPHTGCVQQRGEGVQPGHNVEARAAASHPQQGARRGRTQRTTRRTTRAPRVHIVQRVHHAAQPLPERVVEHTLWRWVGG